MEAFELFSGLILMLVAAVGIVLYVALVIAIPVCRLLDWLAGEEPRQVEARPFRSAMPTESPLITAKPARATRLLRYPFKQRRPVSDEE